MPMDTSCSGATPGPGWRVSCWDVSQQLRLPIRQRLMRKRSGSWSGPPSGSSSHHLLAIEEEDKPSSPCRGKPFNRALAQFTSCERRCASLDTPPTIQVTKVEKEEPVRSQSSQPAEEPAKPKSPEPHFTSMTTAGLSAMLRLKQKLDRKRSGSLPEDRLVVPDLTKHRSIPPSSLAIEDATPPASFSSPVSPAHKRVVRRSTGGSLPGTISPSPRSLAATSHNSALTLSPIPSPACSPLPSPGLSGPAIKFPLLAGSADNVTSVPAKKALTERRSTLADLLGGNAKRTSSPYTPSSVSSLLDLCLESKKRAIEGDFESADDEDQIILNLSYEHTVTRSTRRVTAVTDPPTADIIHFSGSSSEDDADARSIETTGDEVDPTVAPVLENRQECTVSQSTVYREESNEYKEVLNKITGKRALRPKLAAMASKLKNLGHRGSPKRGNTLPEMPDLCKSMRNESKEESWLRKASAPLPSRRREYTPRLQRQHADVLEDSDEKEKSPSGRRQREQCGGRKQSTPHTQKKRKGLDIQTSLVQQKIHPLAIHNPQLQQITRILGAVERKWSDPPSRCLTPELPERSQSNASDTSKRKQRRNDARNLTTAVDSFHSETERTEYWNSGGAGKSSSARALQCTKAGKTTGEKEISVTLQYARSIGFLVVTINKAKNLPYLKEAYVRIIRFEGSVLAETTHTSTVKGKSGPEFKETYMFGLEEEKLLISHLVIELWECDAMEEKRRFGYVVIGPHAGGSGCLQWTRMCKYPNFPSRMWHKFASADA